MNLGTLIAKGYKLSTFEDEKPVTITENYLNSGYIELLWPEDDSFVHYRFDPATVIDAGPEGGEGKFTLPSVDGDGDMEFDFTAAMPYRG